MSPAFRTAIIAVIALLGLGAPAAPAGSTWTLTDVSSGKMYSGTFSGVLPQTISLDSAVGSGTYLVEIDASPNFLPYETAITIRGNSGPLYAGLAPNTGVVPM